MIIRLGSDSAEILFSKNDYSKTKDIIDELKKLGIPARTPVQVIAFRQHEIIKN